MSDTGDMTVVFGGSFDPIHNGHIALARYVLAKGLASKVLLMISARNPLKADECAASEAHRMEMAGLATRFDSEIVPCDLEFSMPKPSYTAQTMRRLKEIYPRQKFRLLIGSDNWLVFEKWKDWRVLLEEYSPIVYPRPGFELEGTGKFPPLYLAKAPVTDISSTQLRALLSKGETGNPVIKRHLDPKVLEYILSQNLYR